MLVFNQWLNDFTAKRGMTGSIEVRQTRESFNQEWMSRLMQDGHDTGKEHTCALKQAAPRRQEYLVVGRIHLCAYGTSERT